jgi:hypothetical protein
MSLIHRQWVTFGARLLVFSLLAALCLLPTDSGVHASAADSVTSDGSSAAQRNAKAALLEAEAAVSRAADLRALWTTAVEALERARAAYARGDFASAREEANAARKFAELGIAQREYPLVR